MQVHSSSELTLEHKENQKPLSNQSWLSSYLSNLRIKGILCSFSLVVEGKIGKKTQIIMIRNLRKDFNTSFALPDTGGNTKDPLNGGGISDSLIRKFEKRSNTQSFCKVINCFALLA